MEHKPWDEEPVCSRGGIVASIMCSSFISGGHALHEVWGLSGVINELVIVMHTEIHKVKLRQLG